MTGSFASSTTAFLVAKNGTKKIIPQGGHRPLSQWPHNRKRLSGAKLNPDRATGRTAGGETAGEFQDSNEEARSTVSSGNKEVESEEGGGQEDQG